VKEVILDGFVPYSPMARQATQKYKILQVSRNLYSDRFLGLYTHHILESYGINLSPEVSDNRRSELLRKLREVTPVVSNFYYDIHLVRDTLIVSFSGRGTLD